MKFVKLIFLSAFLLSVFAFKEAAQPEFEGVFGVSKNDPAKLELRINADKTFTYKDFCDPNRKIDAKGDWEFKNNTIILKNYTSEFPFHTRWKIQDNGLAITSRKGINFYRLKRL